MALARGICPDAGRTGDVVSVEREFAGSSAMVSGRTGISVAVVFRFGNAFDDCEKTVAVFSDSAGREPENLLELLFRLSAAVPHFRLNPVSDAGVYSAESDSRDIPASACSCGHVLGRLAPSGWRRLRGRTADIVSIVSGVLSSDPVPDCFACGIVVPFRGNIIDSAPAYRRRCAAADLGVLYYHTVDCPGVCFGICSCRCVSLE